MADAALSRRQWLERVSVPALGASAAGALGTTSIGAQTPAPSADPLNGARVYNVRDFGAKGDGKTLDTAALQAAIDACTRDGGGTVLVPAGVFHIGTVELKSNVTLHLAAAATLLGSADGKQYHAVDAIPLHGDSTLGDGNWALIFAVDGARTSPIEGPGLIDGQGIQFHAPTRGVAAAERSRRQSAALSPALPPLRASSRPRHPPVAERLSQRARHPVQARPDRRPSHLQPRQRQQRRLPLHQLRARRASATAPCSAQDDACALFGSCKFITVTNCTFSTRWSVFRFGGGTAENITVSNCVLHQVYGCPFKFHGEPGHALREHVVLEYRPAGRDRVRSASASGHRPTPRASGGSRQPPAATPPGIVRNISSATSTAR